MVHIPLKFKPKKSSIDAIDELISQKGKQFDPEVVKIFLKVCLNIEID